MHFSGPLVPLPIVIGAVPLIPTLQLHPAGHILSPGCKGPGATGSLRDELSGHLYLVPTWLQMEFEVCEGGSLGQVGNLSPLSHKIKE